MGLEYCAQADVCRFVSQNLPSERNSEVVTFDLKYVQSNVTLDKQSRRSRMALQLSYSSLLYNNQFFLKLAAQNNQIIGLTYIVDRVYKTETTL